MKWEREGRSKSNDDRRLPCSQTHEDSAYGILFWDGNKKLFDIKRYGKDAADTPFELDENIS
jgi:hypothetical protein